MVKPGTAGAGAGALLSPRSKEADGLLVAATSARGFAPLEERPPFANAQPMKPPPTTASASQCQGIPPAAGAESGGEPAGGTGVPEFAALADLRCNFFDMERLSQTLRWMPSVFHRSSDFSPQPTATSSPGDLKLRRPSSRAQRDRKELAGGKNHGLLSRSLAWLCSSVGRAAD